MQSRHTDRMRDSSATKRLRRKLFPETSSDGSDRKGEALERGIWEPDDRIVPKENETFR